MGSSVRSSLSFGCVLHTDDVAHRWFLGELCHLLGGALGQLVRAHPARSPQALAAAVESRRVDLAWLSPTLLLTSPHLVSARPLVSSVREGVTFYHGVLFVAHGSPWRSPSDLRGARAAWVHPTSAAGCIFPRLALANHGLDPRHLFASEVYCDSHGNVARAVFQDEVDVGATFAVFEGGKASGKLVRAGFQELEGHYRARILLATDPIPSDLVVAGAHVEADLCERLRAAWMGLSREPRARESLRGLLNADDFVPFDPEPFARLREEVEGGRKLGLIDA